MHSRCAALLQRTGSATPRLQTWRSSHAWEEIDRNLIETETESCTRLAMSRRHALCIKARPLRQRRATRSRSDILEQARVVSLPRNTVFQLNQTKHFEGC